MAEFIVTKTFGLTLDQDELNMLYDALDTSPYHSNIIVQDIMGLILEHYIYEDEDRIPF